VIQLISSAILPKQALELNIENHATSLDLCYGHVGVGKEFMLIQSMYIKDFFNFQCKFQT
jgi:hypothetical protein